MKKIFIFSLLIVFALSFVSFADAATKARTASVAQGLQGVYGIGDLSSGNTIEVTDAGAATVANKAVALGVAAGADTLIYTGACSIQSVHIAGAAAGDYAQIYDAITATGTPKFDPRIAVNTSSLSYDLKGAPMATGIYVDVSSSAVFASVVYDY